MKVIGFCFLIYDKINHEELWYKWLNNIDKNKYRIYIHYKNDVKLKYFEKFKLKKCINTQYSDISLVKAQNLLLEASVKDNCSHQILLSHACIPLKPFHQVYSKLFDQFSYFNKADDDSCFPRCNDTLKFIKKKFIKKSSQWCILNNKHAKILISESDYLDWFKYKKTVPDEHCYLSKLYHSKLDNEIVITPNLASGATTFTNWSNMCYPYPSDKGLKNYNVILKDEIDFLLKEACLFGRKFNIECVVNDNNNSIDLTQYLLTRICK